MGDNGVKITILAVSIFIFLTFVVGYKAGADSIKREAVRTGNAQYVGDESGMAVFEWKQATVIVKQKAGHQ